MENRSFAELSDKVKMREAQSELVRTLYREEVFNDLLRENDDDALRRKQASPAPCLRRRTRTRTRPVATQCTSSLHCSAPPSSACGQHLNGI